MPWPALVDLLTSVLIAFMFFILITTVAMSTMTMKMAEDISEKREQAQKTSETEVTSSSAPMLAPPAAVTAHTVEAEDPISEQENQRLRDENELLKQQLAAMGASFAKSKEVKIVEEPAENSLTLLFNPNEAGTTPETETRLAAFVANLGKGGRVTITASEPNGVSFSQARERALTRAMVIRNVLLEQGLEASRITFRYASDQRHQSYNWVRLQPTSAAGDSAR